MLELALLGWNSENYNIIDWALTGISIASPEPVEPISETGDWTFLPYWVALDVGVNAINGDLLLRGPLRPGVNRRSLVPRASLTANLIT